MTLPMVSADGVPFERHLIKRRPGRRQAEFIGRTRLVAGRRVVEEGWIVKTVSPGRARRLVAHYEALAAALPGGEPDGSGFPRVPELVDHSVAEGWLALVAFPGIALSALPEGTTRSGALRATATALARLERAEATHAHWPNRRWSVADEAARLAQLALETGWVMPPFAIVLLAALAEDEHAAGWTPAHRDLNEEQIVASPTDGNAQPIPPARWIDWDEAAIAPVGLDLGNLLAHEGLRALRSGQRPCDVAGILAAYLEAGGRATPRLVARWEAVACLRLALLARRAVHDDDGERNPEWVPVPARDPGEAERRSLALEAMARALASR